MTGLTDVCNFADDATFHACDSGLEDLVNRLEHDANPAIEWFDCKYTKLNEEHCHLVISGHKSEPIWTKKLLRVIIYRRLNFDEYLIPLWKKKARKKLSALAR